MQSYDNITQTLDKNGLPHSYNDQPTGKPNDAFLTWYNHGLIHRDGDKPALVARDYPSNKTFFQHGMKHRDNDKPAQVNDLYNIWYICGMKHRTTGPAEIKSMQIVAGKMYPLKESFYLYGKNLSFESFQSVLSLSKTDACPLWVAFLHEINAISTEDKEAIAEMTKNWTQALPLAWIFRALNMDDNELSVHYPSSFYEWSSDSNDKYSTGVLDKFIKVIEFESAKNN